MLRNMLRNKLIFNQKIMKKYVRKVTRVGKRSLSVVIPAEICDELGIREKQKLVVRRSGKNIIVSDWQPKSKKKK